MARLGMALTLLLLLSASCKPNPADCFDKGDEKACQAICDTGEEGTLGACYEMRARSVAACAGGTGDCKAACDLWQKSESQPDVRSLYVAKVGSAAKMTTLVKTCGLGAAQ